MNMPHDKIMKCFLSEADQVIAACTTPLRKGDATPHDRMDAVTPAAINHY